jgi:hypothetical protein
MRITVKSLLAIFLITITGMMASPAISYIAFQSQPIDTPKESPPTKLDFQTDPKFAAEDEKSGAVGCMQLIAISLKGYGEICQPSNKEVNQAFGQSIDQMNKFIAANSDQELSSVQSAAQRQLEYYTRRNKKTICTKSAREMYELFAASGSTGILEWSNNVTAIPRPPVMNPCL